MITTILPTPNPDRQCPAPKMDSKQAALLSELQRMGFPKALARRACQVRIYKYVNTRKRIRAHAHTCL